MNPQQFLERFKLPIKNLSKLSPSQYYVLEKLGDGLSIKEIASIKGNTRSIKTIQTYLEYIKEKLQIPEIAMLRFFAVYLMCYCEVTGAKPRVSIISTIQIGKTTVTLEENRSLHG